MAMPSTPPRKRSRSLTVTLKGQVTLRKDLLAHLGLQPGQRIDVEVLVRALVQAELVAIPLPVLCELVWVLWRVYGFSNHDCVSAIEALSAAAA
jgi:hypothetical protein